MLCLHTCLCLYVCKLMAMSSYSFAVIVFVVMHSCTQYGFNDSIRLLQTMGMKEVKEPSDSTHICGTS